MCTYVQVCLDAPPFCSTKHLDLLIFILTRLLIIFLLLPFLSPKHLPHLMQKNIMQVQASLPV